jgi:hypothetical protein
MARRLVAPLDDVSDVTIFWSLLAGAPSSSARRC